MMVTLSSSSSACRLATSGTRGTAAARKTPLEGELWDRSSHYGDNVLSARARCCRRRENALMAMVDLDLLRRYVRMCNDGWLEGWHDAAAGNTHAYRPQARRTSRRRALRSLASPRVARVALPCNLARGTLLRRAGEVPRETWRLAPGQT